MTAPGQCPQCNRQVRWAEIQTCPRRRQQAPPLWDTGCSDCVHASEPLRAADGSIIGTKSCGCSGESKASGIVWITCGVSGRLVQEPIGKRCVRKEKADHRIRDSQPSTSPPTKEMSPDSEFTTYSG